MAEELAASTIFSHNLTVETPIDIDEMIYVLSPEDLPMLHGVNSDGFPVLPRIPVSNTEFNWLEEEVPLPRGVTAEALDNSETEITMAAGDAVKFSVGDGIRIDDEVMIVTAVDTATEALTVTRGSAGETNTTVATHVTGSEVVGLGTILIEGAVGSGNFQGRDKFTNYCQIWSKTIQMSRTEQGIRKYGVPSELARQTKNMMQNAAQGIEQALLYGVKHKHATTYRRQTGGLAHFVTGNVDSTSDWITVDGIQDRQQAAYDLGGNLRYVMARPIHFRALNNITGSERVSSQGTADGVRGRNRAMTVLTEFGNVNLLRNRWCRNTDAFGFGDGALSWRVFDPMQMQKLAKTDDTDKWLFVAEGGFEVKGADHMVRWSGLDPSAALPTTLV